MEFFLLGITKALNDVKNYTTYFQLNKVPVFLGILLAALTLGSCQKQIEIDLPDAESKLVVEGKIEQGLPPIVMLTRSIGYFEPTDINTFDNLFVHDAVVTLSNGTTTETLLELCTAALPDSTLALISALIGISAEDLATFNYCIYSTFNTAVWGEVGKTYSLNIDAEGKQYSALTQIPSLTPLDELWYEVYGDSDTLGFIWATLSDPDTVGNGYRWMAQRINQYTDGTQKDANFIAPQSSVFDDEFFNGLTFDFAYDRGIQQGSLKPDDRNDERGFFKTGDTVVVKFSALDKGVFEFYRAFETQAFTSGNPFAAPTTVFSNIEGGALGVWAGFGVSYDTVICIP
jgi:hypothetical protein